ncbi:MAG: glucosaminidase domain-containing protein [Flavobacteriales bacterium]|nr:glucosaminidase domain-containing protein [Flavobacteriales bacterium]MCB9197360.1 glucosaminidase domain-containing protein [Flavobacteriales bacterium]
MKKFVRKRHNKKDDISSNDLAFRLLKRKLSKFRRTVFIALSVLTLTSLVSFSRQINALNEILGPIFVDAVPDLTPENVYNQLEKFGVEHPEIVLRQSILETGWFECKSCSLQHNNIFGFRYKKKYIEFDNWVEAVKYYKHWQDERYNGGDYYHFLKSVGYATSPTYISKLKSIKLDFLK